MVPRSFCANKDAVAIKKKQPSFFQSIRPLLRISLQGRRRFWSQTVSSLQYGVTELKYWIWTPIGIVSESLRVKSFFRPFAGNSGPMPKSGSIRILVVDDHPVVCRGLTAILKAESDMEVVGQAANGKQAV